MSLVSPERQYAINYEISREAPSTPQAAPAAAKKGGKPNEPAPRILLDDAVTLRQTLGLDASKTKVSINDFRQSVGKDTALVEATLRNKIAEYGLRPNTKVELSRDDQGNIQANANAPQAVLAQMSQDLNNNQEFRAAFKRLGLNQPTLDYVANVNKVSSAYGAGNSLFKSLVSSHDNNNSLTDIAHRYEKLKQTFATDPLASMLQTTAKADFRFTLNG